MNGSLKVAILGGTGDLGSGLARCWAKAGHAVVLGSRSPEKGEALARALAEQTGGTVSTAGYVEAVRASDIVVLAVPYGSHEETLRGVAEALVGKILIDAVVPLAPPKVSVVKLPAAGSAAVEAQSLLGPGVRVVSAFHNVGAKKLHDGAKAECDVLVFSDDAEARGLVADLAGDVATRGLEAGTLANSAAAEALTSVLIWMNRRYKAVGAGIGITGLPESKPD
ncbi:NADPH-dependent F420 reductase [Methylobacterium sp. NEAU 140]|uniref:NADPH-dependent F420 reductase n=1 Tax=Methylobacterium sp. NEAU 140 TaxID=3064945 RepID=UPI002734F66E|nr:NADPH-dependent F420 reductase [Methylobacterium sp. NEAU 140]MDP4026595.1 NADPH-dependent F420 reductase [Methylobacterium sp. NEAU 140]